MRGCNGLMEEEAYNGWRFNEKGIMSGGMREDI